MTEAPQSAEDLQAALKAVAVESIILWECAVERGSAEHLNVGEVRAKLTVEPSIGEEGAFRYLIKSHYEFENSEDELIAKIDADFLCSYEGPESSVGEQLLREFAPSVVMQVTPFQREFLANVTNRLGMPPFFLPLIRSRDVSLGAVADASNPHDVTDN